jgi:hypothetical protein
MALVGSSINSPTNAIYMTMMEHIAFGQFQFYLDKEAVSRFGGNSLLSADLGLNFFSTRIFPTSTEYVCPEEGRTLTNGSREVDVEFRTREEDRLIEPPNPEYLKVHAAFAKVLHLCGAAEYIESVERDAEMEGTLRLNGETDFASYLQSRLVLVA